jgi:hypothetical protein
MNGKGQAQMQPTRSGTLSPSLSRMTVAGGLTFWVISVATSLLPIAAEYRAAFSNWSAQTVWVAALVIGMIISWSISTLVLLAIRQSPAKNPLVISVTLSVAVLLMATLLIDLPRSINGADRSLHYFLIGLAFNAVRFFGLGIAIGGPRRWHLMSLSPSGHLTNKGAAK